MVGEITGQWFWFLIGNLLSDTGIALFALITYKINEATSDFSHKLLEEASRAAADAADAASNPPESPSPADPDVPYELQTSSSRHIDEGPPGYSLTIPDREEIEKWQRRQLIPLVLFGIGIAIQIAVLIIPEIPLEDLISKILLI